MERMTTECVCPENESIVKDGVVLGYTLGALVDGKRIQPPSGYPLGFMVRRGDSWCADYDSSWNTLDAAKERASRLNDVDEKVKKDQIKWDVYVC